MIKTDYVKVDGKNKTLLPMFSLVDIEPYALKEVHNVDPEMFSHIQQLMDGNTRANLNMPSYGDERYGYLRCRLSDNNRGQGVSPFAAFTLAGPTFLIHPFIDLPFLVKKAKGMYIFDIMDLNGNVIKEYEIKGVGSVHTGIYNHADDDYLHVKSFKDALRKLDKQLLRDADEINEKLRFSKTRTNNITPDCGPVEIRTAINEGDYLKALSEIDRLCATTQDPENFYMKALILKSLNRHTEAYANIKIACDLNPYNEYYLFAAGEMAQQAGALSLALDYFKRCYRIRPDLPNLQAYILNLTAYFDSIERENEERKQKRMDNFINATNAASSALGAFSMGMSAIGNSNSPAGVQPSNGGNGQQGGNVVEETCSMCGGKGWIPGNKGVSLTSDTHWCEDCHKEVSSSHSHDECPSCRGNKTIKRVRW